MKYTLLLTAMCCCMLALQGQINHSANDTFSKAVPMDQCPQELIPYINNDQLKTKAVLFMFNESLHPLGKYEFFDAGSRVGYIHKPIKMNRCSLIYVDTGLHLFHTMYQQLKEPVYFGKGEIYMVRLFTRTIWPIGGISVIKKNEKGEKEEYAAVLLEYINGTQAAELLNKMKKKEVLVNE